MLDLGLHALPDFDKTEPDWEYAPLRLVRCRECGLVQLQHEVDRDRLFRNYWYRSGTSETMRTELENVAGAAMEFLGDGDSVLDIGSNDGTLLAHFGNEIDKIGIDPSNRLDLQFQPDGWAKRWVWCPGYFSADMPFPRPVKVITSIAMFYSVSDPQQFVADIAKVLAPDGVWIVQMNDLFSLMHNVAYDIIGHEHIAIYGFPAFNSVLSRHGLEVFKEEHREINGGSVRYYVGHKDRYVQQDQPQKAPWRASTPIYMSHFAQNIHAATSDLYRMVTELAGQGTRIHILGASTRGSTIIQAAGLDERWIDMASDRDPNKHGFLFPGTQIPIVSEEVSRNAQPDVYLVLPYSYIDQLKVREAKFLARGGKMIVPVPAPTIVEA